LLTSTLGAPAATLGLIEGVADGLAGVAKLGGGALADDPTRRRQVAIGGYGATALERAMHGPSPLVLRVARRLDGERARNVRAKLTGTPPS
jgi:hypothetical protein